MIDTIFTFANTIALLAWVVLILIPNRDWLYKFYFYLFLPVFAVIYGGITYAFITISGGSFSSLEGVITLFQNKEMLVAGWIHYLIFDLFVGIYIAKDADKAGLPRLMQSFFLFATFMFGPIGLFLYLFNKFLLKHSYKYIYYFHPANLRPDPENKTYKVILYSLIFNIILLPITLLAYFFDYREIDGVNVWVKPIKFVISISLHTLTVLMLLPLIKKEYLESAKLKVIAYIGSYAFILEIIYISIQSMRGRASHFNNLTVWENVLYLLMGVGAVLGVALSFYVGYLIYKFAKENLPTGLTLGASVGLMLGSVLTFIVAGFMGSHNSHFIDLTLKNASAIPFLGWSTVYGDLRVPHFFATHTIQFLPLIGLFALYLNKQSKNQKAVVYIAALFCVLITAYTFWQALNNIPFIG